MPEPTQPPAASSPPAPLAFVSQAIRPEKEGCVWYEGAFWFAQSSQETTLPPDVYVRVVGRKNMTLIVEPIEEFSPLNPTSYDVWEGDSGIRVLINKNSDISWSVGNITEGVEREVATSDVAHTTDSDLSDLDEVDAQIVELQSAISLLRQDTRQSLSELAEVVEKL